MTNEELVAWRESVEGLAQSFAESRGYDYDYLNRLCDTQLLRLLDEDLYWCYQPMRYVVRQLERKERERNEVL